MRPSIFCVICVVWLPTSASFALPSPAQQADHRDLSYFTDDSGQQQPIRTRDDWAIRRSQILSGMQEAMGSLPSSTAPADFGLQVVADARLHEVRRITLTMAVENGDRLPLDLYLPAELVEAVDPASLLTLSANKKLPAILALHPTGALGKRIIAGEGPRGNRQYGLELARRGYVVVCPDYPSFGDYQYDFQKDAYVSGTMKGIYNHMRCIDFLTALPCVDESRIGAIGHSLGGHNAMFVAVFDPRIQIAVSSCGWTPFHSYYGGRIEGWTSDRYMPLLKKSMDSTPTRSHSISRKWSQPSHRARSCPSPHCMTTTLMLKV